MRTRAFVIHLPTTRAHLVPELKKIGIDVVFFASNGDLDEPLFERLAPGVPHCSNAHALSSRSSVLGGFAPARVEDIERLSATAQAALSCLDRSNSANRPFTELHQIYLSHIGVWRRMLEKYDPQVVIFTDNPHHGWDNVLYDLCKADGRQTVLFGYTDLPSRVVVKQSIFEVPGPSPEEIDAAALLPLPDVERDASNFAFTQRINDLGRLRKQVSLFGAARLMIGIRQFGRAGPMPYLYEDETPRQVTIRWYRFLNRLHGRTLWRHYEKVAIAPDVSRPYVYFPLPMQPEMTTVPLGGHFGEQLNLIRTVAEALPSGWRLYVKEHPHQFVWPLAARGRTRRQYELLAAIPGVDIIRLDAGSLHLAKHARAVATATGTAGFEGIGMGVPALVFGSPWYRCAPGVSVVQTLDECRAALARIAKGELKPDPVRVRAYKHLMMTRYTIETSFDPQITLEADSKPEETAGRLAAGIRAVLETSPAPH